MRLPPLRGGSTKQDLSVRAWASRSALMQLVRMSTKRSRRECGSEI